MKEKIVQQLLDIETQISESIIRHTDLMDMLDQKKCILTMAISSPQEINSIDELPKD